MNEADYADPVGFAIRLEYANSVRLYALILLVIFRNEADGVSSICELPGDQHLLQLRPTHAIIDLPDEGTIRIGRDEADTRFGVIH
jgi:hypothetical protein